MANSKRKWVKWVFTVLLLAALAAAGFWFFNQRGPSGNQYVTVTVTRGDLTQAVTATGQLAPVVNVQVGSQISGIIRKLYADYNSQVKSNQLIAEVDPSTYQVNVQKAEAELANAKANLALAEVQARRAQELFTNNLISASDHDTAVAQQQQAEAVVKSDEATLQNAKVQLSYCTIVSPVDGVVVSRNVDVGQTVAASFNTPTLFVIAGDLAKMQIDALVSEADIGGVATNQDVTFTVDAYPYRTFRGKVSQVRYGAITNQNVINYDCVIGVDNNDLKLLPGMTANVSIITAQRENALYIPNAALRFRPPEAIAAEAKTNLALQAAASKSGSPAGGGSRGGGGQGMRSEGEGGGPRRSGGPGGFGAGGGERRGGRAAGEGGPGGRSGRGERVVSRTIYSLPARQPGQNPADVKPIPVQVKVGISDGVNTEVIEGLEEGTQVVTGTLTPLSTTTTPTASPFGGPSFRRF